jgi:RNA recognition motif-containing protein
VFVGNLAWNTTADELRNFMSSVGTVLDSTVQCHADSGRSKGWG